MSPMEKNRDLIVYVEIDRCMADAIQAITGCSLGHRTLKHMNYGKFAATFVDAGSGKAVRVSVIDKDRTPPARPGRESMSEAVRHLSEVPEGELLRIQGVRVDIPPGDMPGLPKHRENCAICGEKVLDDKEIAVDGRPLCRNCAQGSYYTVQ